MFAILKKKSPHEQEAKRLYAQCLSTVRKPYFYETFAVNDSMDARFDLLLAHLYLVIEHSLAHDDGDAEALNQTLFDVMFADMDQTLREMGIGDMGVPKRMRKMMKGFNGRMHSYQQAYEQLDTTGNKTELDAVIARNIYALEETHEHSAKLADYFIQQRGTLKSLDASALIQGANDLFQYKDS